MNKNPHVGNFNLQEQAAMSIMVELLHSGLIEWNAKNAKSLLKHYISMKGLEHADWLNDMVYINYSQYDLLFEYRLIGGQGIMATVNGGHAVSFFRGDF